MMQATDDQAAARVQPVPPPPPADLTDAELRALVYFGIGVGSEGSVGGRDVSNHLAFAGTIRNGVMDPVGNSGYSLGTLQTDLGQRREVAPALVTAYQTWANAHHRDWVLTEEQRTQTIADLSRDGRTIERQHGRAMDANVKTHLDTFLATDDGKTFVHNQDVGLVDELMTGVIPRVQQTALYRDASADDQARLVTMVAKVQNQSGDSWTPTMVRSMNNGTYRSVGDVSTAVDNLRPRVSGPDDYLESGRDNALRGAEAFIALRNADPQSPLHPVWQNVLANPLVNPTQLNQDAAHPNLSAEYATVKNVFLQKEAAPAFIEALDRGGAHSYGPLTQDGRFRSAGFYASGNDFAVWNRDGAGHANIGGDWSEITRNDLSRTRNRDGTIDLNINQNGTESRLLHVDPNAPPLRAVPAAAELDYHNDRSALGLASPAAPRFSTAGGSGRPDVDDRQPPDRGERQQHSVQGFSPSHPDYALYAALRERLPKDLSDEVVAHTTLCAKQGGIERADQLDKVMVRDGNAFIAGKIPGDWAKVDVSIQPPPLQETVRQLETFSQHQEQQRTQGLAMEQQQSQGAQRHTL